MYGSESYIEYITGLVTVILNKLTVKHKQYQYNLVQYMSMLIYSE